MPSEPAVPVRAGRPSRSDAAQLTDRILAAATARFLADGYGPTSIEAVVKAARISKRTFYVRFAGKAALFEAVVRRLVGGWRVPFDAVSTLPGTLEQRLEQIARFMLAAALTPEAIALHRLIMAEAARFPELARMISAHGAGQAVAIVGAILGEEIHAGRLTLPEPRFAAEQFLHLVLAGPQRRALGLDAPLDPRELDRWVTGTVRLFLDGCRGLVRGASDGR
jgi:TetR/AcrR family transcriptional repressor of mexJK operon